MAGVKGRSGRRKIPKKTAEVSCVKHQMMVIPDMTDEGKKYFDLFCLRCSDMGILNGSDEIIMNGLAITFCEWIDSYREVKKNGKYEIDPRTGNSRVSAMFRIERKLFADLIALCREFGFTPSSRATLIGMMKPPEENKEKSVSVGFISSDIGEPMQ